MFAEEQQEQVNPNSPRQHDWYTCRIGLKNTTLKNHRLATKKFIDVFETFACDAESFLKSIRDNEKQRSILKYLYRANDMGDLFQLLYEFEQSNHDKQLPELWNEFIKQHRAVQHDYSFLDLFLTIFTVQIITEEKSEGVFKYQETSIQSTTSNLRFHLFGECCNTKKIENLNYFGKALNEFKDLRAKYCHTSACMVSKKNKQWSTEQEDQFTEWICQNWKQKDRAVSLWLSYLLIRSCLLRPRSIIGGYFEYDLTHSDILHFHIRSLKNHSDSEVANNPNLHLVWIRLRRSKPTECLWHALALIAFTHGATYLERFFNPQEDVTTGTWVTESDMAKVKIEGGIYGNKKYGMQFFDGFTELRAIRAKWSEQALAQRLAKETHTSTSVNQLARTYQSNESRKKLEIQAASLSAEVPIDWPCAFPGSYGSIFATVNDEVTEKQLAEFFATDVSNAFFQRQIHFLQLCLVLCVMIRQRGFHPDEDTRFQQVFEPILTCSYERSRLLRYVEMMYRKDYDHCFEEFQDPMEIEREEAVASEQTSASAYEEASEQTSASDYEEASEQSVEASEQAGEEAQSSLEGLKTDLLVLYLTEKMNFIFSHRFVRRNWMGVIQRVHCYIMESLKRCVDFLLIVAENTKVEKRHKNELMQVILYYREGRQVLLNDRSKADLLLAEIQRIYESDSTKTFKGWGFAYHQCLPSKKFEHWHPF